jgi:hypothetical protein
VVATGDRRMNEVEAREQLAAWLAEALAAARNVRDWEAAGWGDPA